MAPCCSVFISGLDLADMVVNSGLLELSCEASSDQQGSSSLSLRYKLDKKSKYTLIAFTTSTLSRKELLRQGGDLVSSKTLKELELPIFDFLCTERNRLFQFIETGELLRTPLTVTGHSIGGSVAFYCGFGQHKRIQPSEAPLCITFGRHLSAY
uniref:Uncharacterized protein n=1 Tax=Salix viminalis TaxID=40686 RepID=A0A6N2LMV6_SALVM